MNGKTGLCLPFTVYRLPYLTMRTLLLLTALSLLLAGCGYKGPLTLPKPKPEAQKSAPSASSQPEDKKPAPE